MRSGDKRGKPLLTLKALQSHCLLEWALSAERQTVLFPYLSAPLSAAPELVGRFAAMQPDCTSDYMQVVDVVLKLTFYFFSDLFTCRAR